LLLSMGTSIPAFELSIDKVDKSFEWCCCCCCRGFRAYGDSDALLLLLLFDKFCFGDRWEIIGVLSVPANVRRGGVITGGGRRPSVLIVVVVAGKAKGLYGMIVSINQWILRSFLPAETPTKLRSNLGTKKLFFNNGGGSIEQPGEKITLVLSIKNKQRKGNTFRSFLFSFVLRGWGWQKESVGALGKIVVPPTWY
jgi:hypothetical protein